MITHLGDINLGEVRGVHGASLKVGYDFATHERPLGKATKQRLGGRLDEWRLTFNLHHHFCDPQSVLESIHGICAKGAPVQLVFDYIDYQGWVTLDDVDVSYQEIAPNGQPLVITGTLTLTEYVGDTTERPTKPAVRAAGQSLSAPAPVQTAMTANVADLLPTRQPMQHLQEALIAQHRARAVLRAVKEASNGDFSQINHAVQIVNDYFDSEDWMGADIDALPRVTDQAAPLERALDERQVFYAELAREAATRWLPW